MPQEEVAIIIPKLKRPVRTDADRGERNSTEEIIPSELLLPIFEPAPILQIEQLLQHKRPNVTIPSVSLLPKEPRLLQAALWESGTFLVSFKREAGHRPHPH